MKVLVAFIGLLTILNAYTFNYSGMTCGHKHKCSEIKSCKEAYFYLEVCGVTKLDRDKDGIPCESLCKWVTLKNFTKFEKWTYES